MAEQFADNFNGAGVATNLGSWSPDVGTTWTVSGAANTFVVLTNGNLKFNESVGSGYAYGDDSNVGGYVEVTTPSTLQGNVNDLIAVRLQDSDNCIGLGMFGTGAAGFRVVTIIAGVVTDTIHQFQGVVDTLYRIEDDGTDIRFYAGGSLIYTHADSTNFTAETKKGVVIKAEGVSSNLEMITSYASGTLTVGDTITLTELIPDRIYQRDTATNNKAVTVTGTYSGTPTAIQARVVEDGTDTEVVTWTTIDAAPSAGSFSGTITVPEGGWYNVDVRFSNDTGVTDDGTTAFGVGTLIGCIGQSNMENWFTDGSGQVPDALLRKYTGSWAVLGAASNGATAFGNRIIANMASPVPVGLLDYSKGGTALRSEADSGSGYWLNTAASSPYDDLKVGVTANGGELEFVVWAQGERDARSGLVTEAEYEGSTGGLEDFITNQIRTDITNASDQTNLPFVISLLGRGTDVGDTDVNFQAIRNAQQNVANGLADCYRVTTTDLPLVDTIHYTPAGYTTHGEQCAQVVLELLGDETYSRGPQIVNWQEVSSTQTDITIAHDGGTDFTPASTITGFQILDAGTPVTVSAAVRQNATTVRLTHTAIVGVRTARYMYGANPAVTSPVVDNTALTLPLEGSASIQEFVAGVTQFWFSIKSSIVKPFKSSTRKLG